MRRKLLRGPAIPLAGLIVWQWLSQRGPEYAYIFVPLQDIGRAFVAAFGTLGYAPCSGADLEPGFERVAIYADSRGTPKHAARQLPSGFWTSKLGSLQTIEHATLRALEGACYGHASTFLKRPLSG